MLDERWYSEAYEEAGIACSLRIVETLHEEQTPYQALAVHRTEAFGNLMTLDGLVMLTGRDNFVYHEMMSHPALFSHPRPTAVAIIGGGDCGTLREVLRHDAVRDVTQVDIDEAVTRAAERFFPELTEANGDERATLLFTDGIRWMAERPEGSLDVIIVDSTDPVGPAEGLFATPFYESCHRALGPGGLLVQQSESPLLHTSLIVNMRRQMRAAGFDDAATLQFPQPTYPSGWWSATLARREEPLAFVREADAEAEDLGTRYYSAAVHRGALAAPAFLERACREAGV